MKALHPLAKAFILIVCVISSHRALACHGLPILNYTYTVGATGVTISGDSDPATCGCGPYWLQTQLACSANSFTGAVPVCVNNTLMTWNGPGVSYNSYPFYNSLLNVPNYTVGNGWFDDCLLESYNTVFIPFSDLCPGVTYFFRTREYIGGAGGTHGAWTMVNSFTVPGIAQPATLTLMANPTAIICTGGVQLSATISGGNCNTFNSCNPPVTTYSWTSSPSTPPTPTTTTTNTLNIPAITATTTFSVFVKTNPDQCGTLVPNPAVVTVPFTLIMPVASFSTSANQCLNGNIYTFNADTAANPNSTYSWDFGDGQTGSGPMATHSYTAAGTYTVMETVIMPGACAPGMTMQTVTVYPEPTLNITTNSPVCNGQTILLNVTGANSYYWTGPNGFSSSLSNPSIGPATINDAGVYSVTGTSQYGCVSSGTTQVVVNTTVTLNPSSNSPVCENQALILNSNYNGGGSCGWTGPNSYTAAVSNPTLSPAGLNAAGVYTVTALDAMGCVSTGTLNVVILSLPDVTIVPKNNSGCAPLCYVDFTATSNHAVSAYQWQLGNGNNSNANQPTGVCYPSAGTYTCSVTVTDTYGCLDTANSLVYVYPVPNANFDYYPFPVTINNPYVNFSDLSSGAPLVSWFWNFDATNTHTSTQQNPSFTYSDTGLYVVTLMVTSDHGCADTVSKALFVKEDYVCSVPNAFTPNGDGLNDVFRPVIVDISQYSLLIFDRWGTQVFSSNDINKGWDGSIRSRTSNPMQQEVFLWRIDLKKTNGASETLTGHVTLLR